MIGIGRRQESLKRAKELGAVTATTLKLSEGVAEADVVIVCTPVAEIAGHLFEAAAAAPKQAILTDAGSTKGHNRCRRGNRSFRAAGASSAATRWPAVRRTGAQFARADLFEGRVVVITPTRKTKPDDKQAVADFWSALGATVMVMSPEAHDKALATTSHLPHLVCVGRGPPHAAPPICR